MGKSAGIDVNVSLRDASIFSANEWTNNQALEVQAVQGPIGAARSVRVTIPAGGIAVVELVTAR